MRISYSHRFIFIHVFKTAGVSIKNVLNPYALYIPRPIIFRALKTIGITMPFDYKYKTFSPHVDALELRRELPERIFNSFYKFAFVRNPWDLQVSLYFFMKQDTDHYQHELINSMKNFDEYIEWRVSNTNKLQKNFITDTEGNLLIDFVGRFENLQEDFNKVCNRLKIDAQLPHENKSKHKDYRTHYNDKTREMISNAFNEDIELFGYSF